VPSQSTTLEAEPTNTPASRRWTSSRVRIELLGAAISAGLALAGVTAVLRLWKAHLNISIASGGDVMLSLMVVKNMQTTGWYQSTPDLGAPFGQDLTAYPSSVGDFWHMATLKVLSLFMTPAGTVNVFFIGCFRSSPSSRTRVSVCCPCRGRSRPRPSPSSSGSGCTTAT
jgi:hypothetical protein